MKKRMFHVKHPFILQLEIRIYIEVNVSRETLVYII